MPDEFILPNQQEPQEQQDLPPPTWDDIKAAPEFQQLDPKSQFDTYNRWRSDTLQHASTFSDFGPDVQREFVQAQQPEMQRLAGAAGQVAAQNLHDHLQNVPTDQQPEGFWGTMGRAFASRIVPAAGTAAGAVGAGLLATPETVGIGTVPAAIAGGIGAGLATEEAQKQFMGDEWYQKNKQQMDINAQAHPYAHQIGTLVPFLLSAWAGGAESAAAKSLVGKVVGKESGRIAQVLGGAAERVIAGGAGGARAGALSGVEEKGEITPQAVAEGAGRGITTLGAVSLFPAMKTILGQAAKGIPDAAIMAVTGETYDAIQEGRAPDFKKMAQETGGGITPFVLQNALLSFIHGAPLRAKAREPGPAEQTTKPEIEEAIKQRQQQLQAEKDRGTITPDQQEELDDHNKVLEAVEQEAPQSEAQPVAPPAPVEQPTIPEQPTLTEQVNKGLAAGEQPTEPTIEVPPEVAKQPIQEGPTETPEQAAANAGTTPIEQGKPTEEARQKAEAQAKTLPIETLRAELAKPDAGFHDIIQAELDRRANAGTVEPIKETAPAAPEQTLEERIAAKTEAENAKAEQIKQIESQIPIDRPFPKDIVAFKSRDQELAAKQAWLDHVENPDKDFKLPDLQKQFGREAGTKLYHEMWPEGGGTKHLEQLHEGAVGEEVPPQLAEEETEKTAPELTQQAETPTEAPASPHEKALMDFGIADPQATLDKANEKARAKGLPEMTMEQLAKALTDKVQKAPEDTGVASGKTVRVESSLPVNTTRVLENTQALENIGALHPTDPLGEALRGLSEKGNPIQRFIAKLLLNSGIDTSKVKVLFDDKMVQKALYDAKPHNNDFSIYLNRNSEHGKSSIYGALLHEALHHVTVWKLLPGFNPNAHEAVAIQTLDRLLARGRQAAWKEMFGKNGTQAELNEFTKWLNNPNDPSVKINLSPAQLFKLYDNYSRFYGLANTKELVAEITNPDLVDFLGNLPADTSIKGRALNLLHQARNMIMQLVSGRPVEQQDNIQKYFESVAALTQEAPERIGNTKLNLRLNDTLEALRESAGISKEEIDRIKERMIPAGNKFLFSMAPYDTATNKLGKHTLPQSGILDEDAFKKVGGVNKPLNKTEIALYKTLVPKAFQNGKVDIRMLDQGLRTKGPTVEVKRLGPSGDMSPIERDNARLIHELDTKLPNWRSLASNEVPPELQDLYNRQYQLSQQIEPRPYTDAKYSFIGPKPPEQMPGYVEGLVRLPLTAEQKEPLQERFYPKEEFAKKLPLFSGPHYGEEDKNVLSTYRGYEETLPTGEKAFNLIEVQSDWGQMAQADKSYKKELHVRQDQNGKWEVADNTMGLGPKFSDRDSAEVELWKRQTRDIGLKQHPLLDVYNELGLKAAIQHAKEIGATKIILPDAETAMMSEGHDQQFTGNLPTPGNWAAMSKDPARTGGLDDVNVIRNHDYRASNLEALKKELASHGGEDNYKIVKVTPDLYEQAIQPPQAGGMRLNYDKVLPSIMEKLTGSKGEHIDLGPHKSTNNPDAGRREWFATEEEARQYAATLEGNPIVEKTSTVGPRPWGVQPDHETVRGSPVFKDAAGNRKINSTGRAYDISSAPSEFPLTDRLLIGAGINPDELPKDSAKVAEEEFRKSPGMYASLMHQANDTPFVGNFLGSHAQMFKDAQEELKKNPNAARERLDFLTQHKAAPTAEDYALFLSKLVPLRQDLRDALVKGDPAEIQKARAAVDNWSTEVFQKSSISGKALQALQGSVDINTGDYFTLKNYYKMVYGKELTSEKEEKFLNKTVQETTAAKVDDMKAQIKVAQEIPKMAEGAAAEATKGTKLTSAEKKAGAAAGVSAAKDASGKEQGWLDFGWGLDPKAAGTKLAKYFEARFAAKPYQIGQKNLTTREVGNLWQFIKANYLQGISYVRPDDLVNKVAKDLGIDPRAVKEAIAAPKTIRQYIDDRYRAQSQQRAIMNATKTWMDLNSKGTFLKAASKLWEAPRSLAVIGHVNPSLTHAGSLLFRPTSWKQELPSTVQAFRASFVDSMIGKLTGNKEWDSRVYHEKLMQDTMGSEDYGKLTNLGLAAKVGVLDDIGQYNTFLGKIGVAGNRGMDVLKSLRMQLAQKEYNLLKGDQDFQALDDKAKDDVLREMVARVNSETGTTTAGHTMLGDFLSGRGRGDWRTFLFAPKLEGSRWQQMVVDPLRATGLWLKGNSATAGEKYFRKRVFMRQAELMVGYGAALTANAAILKAIGSDDKINMTDPTRSDWLSFKVNGQTVIAPSSFLAPLRLSLSVALSHVIPAENRQPYTDKIVNYAMGKVTPTISDIVELARAKQQYTGRPIEALQNLYEGMGVKFSPPRNPKDPISLYEWAATKGPIPLSATVEGWYNAMTEQGADPKLTKTIIGASLALSSSIFAVHQHPTTPEKTTQ